MLPWAQRRDRKAIFLAVEFHDAVVRDGVTSPARDEVLMMDPDVRLRWWTPFVWVSAAGGTLRPSALKIPHHSKPLFDLSRLTAATTLALVAVFERLSWTVAVVHFG